MAVIQPPASKDHPRSSWEFELTSQFNTLEGRAQALLNIIDTKVDLEALAFLVDHYGKLKERVNDTAVVYVQDDQPTPTYTRDFMWLQTNVNSDGDFSLWFCKEG